MSRFGTSLVAVFCVTLLPPVSLFAKVTAHWYQPHYLASVEEASNQLQFLSPHFAPLDMGPKWTLLTTGYSLERVSENKLGINLSFTKSGVEQKTQYFWSWVGGYDAPVSTPYKDDIVTSIVYADIEYFEIWNFPKAKDAPATWCVAPIGGSSFRNNVICVPSETDAQRLADALATLTVACGKSLRTPSGMGMVQMPNKDLQKHPEQGGCLIREVDADGPAEQAGIREGDILHAVNGITCTKEVVDAALKEATEKPDGGVVHAEILRRGKAMTVNIQCAHVEVNAAKLQQQIANLARQNAASQPAVSSQAAAAASPSSGFRLGIRVRAVTDSDVTALGLPKPKGVVVTSVEKGSLADEMQLQSGDVIIEVNGSEIGDVDFFSQFVRSGTARSFHVWRKGQAVELTVPQSM